MQSDLYDVPGFYGYKVDRYGNVYSCLGKGCRDKYDETKWLKEPKALKPRPTRKGYLRVSMRSDSTNKRTDMYIHRIVASVFIPNPDNLSDVNHKDNNPFNNKVENLEWMSHRDNLEYGFSHGYKARSKDGKLKKKQM